MDIHNSITDIHNSIMEIHNSVMDIHNYMLAIMDIRKSIMGIHNYILAIMDIHNSIMDIHNYRVYALLAFHTLVLLLMVVVAVVAVNILKHDYWFLVSNEDVLPVLKISLWRSAGNCWSSSLHVCDFLST